MARDPHDALSAEPAPAPRVLARPADAPPPLAPVGDGDPVQTFRRFWSARLQRATSPRGWLGRVSGRTDRSLLLAMAAATDALVAQCDLITERLAALESLTANVTDTFGEEVTLLRAEVLHLRRTASTAQGSRE
jgi:hypothetical protein